ncbi:MAG: ribbon-helix-helix domain-containing protein [Rhodospirillales bacterium]|nr:ribbon-helix-helix domain-containing protein [Rhodospirillales bacterium]
MTGSIRKRSVVIAGHRTSISLEPEFWTALKDIARRRNASINDLVTEIDKMRAAKDEAGNLSSALRVYVLQALTGAAAAVGAIPASGGSKPV